MQTPGEPTTVRVRDLLRAHDALFLDAYGVLVDAHGALPGAPELIAELNRSGTRYCVLTNDASRLPTTMEARFRRLGLAIARERIVSSGDLIGGYFAEQKLAGARVVVVGSKDSCAFVRDAGAEVVPASPEQELDVLVVCDEGGVGFLETMDAVMSAVFRAVEAGRPPRLLLPNPDLIYPKREREFGFAAGSLALMIEAALALRYPSAQLRFDRLGKPFAPIFAEACRRAGGANAVMVGDQLHTDILGASDYGIASALVASGLTRFDEALRARVRPTYLLPSLHLE